MGGVIQLYYAVVGRRGRRSPAENPLIIDEQG